MMRRNGTHWNPTPHGPAGHSSRRATMRGSCKAASWRCPSWDITSNTSSPNRQASTSLKKCLEIEAVISAGYVRSLGARGTTGGVTKGQELIYDPSNERHSSTRGGAIHNARAAGVRAYRDRADGTWVRLGSYRSAEIEGRDCLAPAGARRNPL